MHAGTEKSVLEVLDINERQKYQQKTKLRISRVVIRHVMTYTCTMISYKDKLRRFERGIIKKISVSRETHDRESKHKDYTWFGHVE